MEMWTLWYPVYWYAGVAKAFTAAVSLGTAWLLYVLTPVALALPSTQQLRLANTALEREISARRDAEHQLQVAKGELEALLQKVQREARRTSAVLDRFFEKAPMGLALMDRDRRFLRSNPGLTAETGRPAYEYIGTRIDELSGGVPLEIEDAVDKIVTKSVSSVEVEARAVRHGVERAWLCNFFQIPGPDDDFLIGIIVQDVTKQRQMEQQRTQAIDSLKDADRRKDEFISILAHELRNPLGPIATAAEIIHRSKSTEPAVTKMAGIIRRQVAHMSRLLDDLLDVSRIARGKLEVHKTPCDLRILVEQVAEDHRHALEEAGASLRLETPSEPLPVLGDAVRLAQALGNYLHNAAKFASGAAVCVRAYRDRARHHAVVEVSDEGAGIDPALLTMLFEPFTQGSQDFARSKAGLGLGLALTKALVELHGGEVAAWSPGPGMGSAFQFRLPEHET